MSTQSRDQEFDVIIVGAGAAGQMAAIAAAASGRRVALLEQMDRPGLKILASGGGHCNLTHMADDATIRKAFGRQGRFIGPGLDAMGPAAVRDLLGRLGVATVVDEQLRVWPATRRAGDVQNALAGRVEQLGVTVLFDCAVERLRIDDGRLGGVETSDGRRLGARCVILACGGRSWPTLGGSGRGYHLATQAGHTIAEPIPALVPLITGEPWPTQLAGVAIPNARIRIDLPRQPKAGVTGDVLFTHRGLSGPAILNISSDVSQALAGRTAVGLRIEIVAGMDAARWTREMEPWRNQSGGRRVAKFLQRWAPASLCEILCKQAGLAPEVTAAQLSTAGRRKLAERLGGVPVSITATEGFGTAFVTRGGVKLKEVDPATCRSRVLAGLFIVGELLDLDGPTGGFNLQWAFASGHLAGQAAADVLTADGRRNP